MALSAADRKASSRLISRLSRANANSSIPQELAPLGKSVWTAFMRISRALSYDDPAKHKRSLVVALTHITLGVVEMPESPLQSELSRAIAPAVRSVQTGRDEPAILLTALENVVFHLESGPINVDPLRAALATLSETIQGE